MKNNFPFFPTSENAIFAKKNGILMEWVEKLLQSEGNSELAEIFSNENPIDIDIFDFPLQLLKKIQGPEENETHRMSPGVWEEHVSKLVKKIKAGFNPAPLIVTDFWNYFEIADGNHRYEALMRTGRTHYWTVFLIKHEKGREYLHKVLNK